MTTPANYLRDALIVMDSANRRGFRNVFRDRVNADPQNTDPITTIYFAVYCTIVDLETEEAQLLEQLEAER